MGDEKTFEDYFKKETESWGDPELVDACTVRMQYLLQENYAGAGGKTSASAIGRALGIPITTAQRLADLAPNPKLSTLAKIAENKPNVNFNWVVSGKGPIYLSTLEDMQQWTGAEAEELQEANKKIEDLKAQLATLREMYDEKVIEIHELKKRLQ